MSRPIPLPANPRILCIRLSALGDTLLTLPAVRALHQTYPGARIGYLTDPRHALILAGCPEVDEVLLLNRKQLQGLRPAAIAAFWHDVLSPIIFGKWDAVFDFQSFTETGLLAALSRAPVRVGRRYKTNASWLYRPWVDAPHPETYMTEAHLDTLQVTGLAAATDDSAAYFDVPPEARTAWTVTRAGIDLSPAARTVGLFVGAARADRRWPPEKFAELASALDQHSERPLQYLVLAGPDESAEAEAVVREARAAGCVIYRASTADLLELAAALEFCDALVGNDTGPLHLSAAVGTPTCGIYRRALPHFLLPEPHRAVVAPDLDVSRVEVADVATAAAELLR
ncbi:MAG: hypothetical protein GKS06_14985 [Acidobacteria bacterium]|nr:hypothetical protein [Acidobacteriota bacterium]